MKRLLTLLLLFTTLTLTTWADKEIKRPSTYNFNRGAELYFDDKNDEALEYFNKELADNPKNGYAYMYVADIQRQADEPGAALNAANSAVKYMPKKDALMLSAVYSIRAQVQCMLKDTTAALADYALAIKTKPDETNIMQQRAQLLYELERYDEATADFQRIINLEPGNSLGYIGIGRNLNAQEKWKESIDILTKATTLESNNSFPYAFRAEAYLGLKEWNKATEDIADALYIDSNNKAFILMQDLKEPALSLMIAKLKIRGNKEPNEEKWPYYIGVIYENNKLYTKAIPYYEKAQQIDADSYNLARLSNCYSELGNYSRALDLLDQAMEMDSTQNGYIASRAELLYDLQRPKEAIELYGDFISQYPDYPGGYSRRGWFKSIIRDYEGAIEDLTLSIAADPEYSSQVYVIRGNCYLALGDLDRARADYKKAIEMEPTPDTYACSQYAYLGLGNIEKAIEVNDTILKRDDNAGAYYDAACLYSRMCNHDKAMEYLKRSLEMGYVNFAHIAQDTDMDYLRQSADFKQLIHIYRQKVEQSNEASQPAVTTHSTGREVVTEVPFTKENGVTNIKCTINNLPLYFVFDTGASTVSLSMVEANFMMKNGYLSKTDVVGSQRFMDANGNVSAGTIINLRHVDFGGLKLENVRASVVRNQHAPLLLGQSILSRLGRIEINNLRNVLTITSKQ